jgi:hypothetical protein
MPSVIPSGTENLPLVRCTLTRETVESGSSVLRSVKYLEDREYSRYLKNVLQARIQVGECDPSADFRSRAIQTYQYPEAAAIDITDFAEIEHDLLRFDQVTPDEMTQISCLFAKYKPATTLDNKNPSKHASDHMERHDKSSSSAWLVKNSVPRNPA